MAERDAARDESVANMTATAAAFARLKANSEAWHDDSKRLHNEYMPTAAVMDEVLATRDRAIMEAWAERDALRARAERAELANTAGRRYLDAADKMYALRAWDGNGKVMRLWGEWRATLAAASDSISHSGESSRLSE